MTIADVLENCSAMCLVRCTGDANYQTISHIYRNNGANITNPSEHVEQDIVGKSFHVINKDFGDQSFRLHHVLSPKISDDIKLHTDRTRMTIPLSYIPLYVVEVANRTCLD